MDAVLSKFLKQKNANTVNLLCTLEENQEQIISSFGGLANMIELCLTNPNASKYINNNCNSDHLDSFAQLLEMMDHTEQEDTTGDIKINTQACKNNIQSQSLTVTTATEFNRSRLTIDCYPNNNLLFRLMNWNYWNILCTNTNISFLSVYKYILSKQLFLIVLCLSSILLIAWITAAFIDAVSDVIIVFLIFGSFMRVLYCIALISIVNITTVDLITNTFDFWFKVYNLLLWIVVMWINGFNTGENGLYVGFDPQGATGVLVIVDQLSQLLTYFLCFVEDAIPVPMNAKRCVIVLLIIAATINVLNRYFFTPDFQWNPFNSKYTQISFKSVLISSQVNLMIFISKPILSDIMRYCKNRIRGVRYKSGNIVTENFNCYRSATIYKRPHVKWYIYN